MTSRPNNGGNNLNVSQFIASLNTLDPNNVEGFPVKENAHHEEDLSIFTNTHFFDFDMGRSTDIAATVDDLLMQQEKTLQEKPHPDEQRHPHQAHHYHHASSSSSSTSTPQFPLQQQRAQDPSLMGIDFSVFQQYSLAGELPAIPDSLSTGTATNTTNPTNATNGGTVTATRKESTKKRKASALTGSPISSSMTPEEEDKDNEGKGDDEKRRRNTAASARFRMKKKMREQEMERTAREMREKIQELETQVMQLDMENKWLRNIVVEKNEARDLVELYSLKQKIVEKASDHKEEPSI